MAYRSNFTGLQVDKGIYNSVDGTRFVTTGVINLDYIGINDQSIGSSQDLENIYNYILQDQSLSPNITNKCLSVIKVIRYDADLLDSSPATVETNEYWKFLRFDGQGHSIYRLGVTFTIGEYNYNLYTLGDNSLDHSKYYNWTLEKTAIEYCEVTNRFLNRIVSELDVSNLVSDSELEAFKELQSLLIYNPRITLNNTSNSGENLYTRGIRINIMGLKYEDESLPGEYQRSVSALLIYSKRDSSSPTSDLNEIGGCRLQIIIDTEQTPKLSVSVNYLPTLGFE